MKQRIFKSILTIGMVLGLFFSPVIQYNGSKSHSTPVAHAASYNLPANTKDGVILHAFDWSFNTIHSQLPQIAAAGYKSIQVSPVQGTKSNTTDPSQWWMLYQPTDESAGNAQLGSLSDFQALCSAAHSYGISIIVDVVLNHMANNGNADQLSPAVVSNFQDPSLYHHNGQVQDWNNRYDITQQGIGMPDLDTSNPTVQQYASDFLNQLVNAGADGFRFDAAKHIETNIGLDAGQSWASNYWNNVLGSLPNKANLFLYGEVLQDGTVDNLSAYESFMNVTASNYGAAVRNAVTSNNLKDASGMGGVNPTKAVDFVETHDNYENGDSTNLTAWQRKAGWAIVASRAGSTPLYLDRPTGNIGTAGESTWNDPDIVAINHFHNAMVGQNEYLRWTNNNQTMLIDRGTIGTVIVNDSSNTYISSSTNLSDGTYTNHGTANATLTVSNGTISGNIPAYSIIVLYDSTVSSNPSTAVAGQSVTITYNAQNRPLQGSSNVTMHWGYDGWSGTTDTAMTSMGNNIWQTTVKVPSTATSELNLTFTNGSTWDNNSSANWSIPVTTSISSGVASYTPHSGYKVDYDSSKLVQGKQFTIYYKGALANSSNVSLHWGTNGWSGITDTAMIKRSDGFWEATITIPSSATTLNADFTDGTNWDNNSSHDWNLAVWPSSNPVQVSPAPTAGQQVAVTYNGSLASSASSITLHWGYNGFTSPLDVSMTKQSNGTWTSTITLPSGSYALNMAFKDNNSTWDSNNSNNYNYSISE